MSVGRLSCKSIFDFAETFLNVQKSGSLDKDWLLINQMFDVNISYGEMHIPKPFYSKIQKWFGKIDDKNAEEAVLRVEKQTIVRVVNKWTYQQTLFNPLRSCRPMNNNFENRSYTDISDELQTIPDKCDFCSPLSYTAIDLWGRIERDTCLTASNCAKYDGQHSLVIFKDHSPLKYNKEKLYDIMSICEEWFQCAHNQNPSAIFPMFNWNCKGQAGASQSHGHAHLLLAEKFHFGKWEFLKNCNERYQDEYPGRNYFLDLIQNSKVLGLTKTIGTAHILTNLTPTFGYDLLIISWNFDNDFRDAIDSGLKTLTKRFKSVTFNVGIHFPPLENGKLRKRMDLSTMQDMLTKKKPNMPFICYMVDRGDPNNNRYTSDVCGMVLSGSSIVSRDPFQIASVVKIPDILWE
ncbi:uncharacterized protein LOC100211359 [Hydra vulgaris]|uniref:Uncharacterized protein LOC100211359 n=1 Tax=Hydra vulgaris TaxID=6087 RepID=A0ABM4D7G0_HYDVU